MKKLLCTKHLAQCLIDVSGRRLSWKRVVKSLLSLGAAAAVYIVSSEAELHTWSLAALMRKAAAHWNKHDALPAGFTEHS